MRAALPKPAGRPALAASMPGLWLLALLALPAALAAQTPAAPGPAVYPVPRDRALSGTPGSSAASPAGLRLTLEDALRLGQETSLQLAIQDSRVREKKAGVVQAEARQWPSLNLQASGSYLTNPQEGIVIEAGSLGFTPSPGSTYPVPFPEQDIVLMEGYEHTYFKLDTSLNWPLITWGKVENGLTLARLGLELEQLERGKAGRSLERDIRQAYAGTLVAQRSLDLLEQARELLATIVADKELAFEQGLVTRAEVLETRKNLEQLKSRHLAASQALRSARAGLGLLCGLDPVQSDSLTVQGSWRSPPAMGSTDQLWQQSLGRSADRQTIQLQSRMADAAVALQQASQLLVPDIALNVQFSVTGQRIPVVQANWTDTWDYNLIITLGTQVPLFDAGSKAASLAQAREQQQQARLGLDLNDRALRVRLQSLVEKLESGKADLAFKQTALDLAREQEKNARVSWENELLTRDQYQLASLQALLATLEVELAGYSLEQALTELEYLAGGPLD